MYVAFLYARVQRGSQDQPAYDSHKYKTAFIMIMGPIVLVLKSFLLGLGAWLSGPALATWEALGFIHRKKKKFRFKYYTKLNSTTEWIY